MQLRELFDLKLFMCDEVIDDLQIETAFKLSCISFFSVVKIKIDIKSDDYINIGSHKVVETFKDIERDIEIAIISPTNFDDFNLPLQYNEDFLMVCEYIIVSASLKNVNVMRNLGIDEMVQQLSMDLNSIKDILNKKYNVAFGSTLQ